MPTVIDLANLGADGFMIQHDAHGGDTGYSVDFAGDINGDGYADIIIGAPTGMGAGPSYTSYGGQAHVIFGKAGGFGAIDLETLAPADGFIIPGVEDGLLLGYSVASAGDVNDDGYADMIVGLAEYNYAAAYIFLGHSGAFGHSMVEGRSVLDFRPGDGFAARIDSYIFGFGRSVSSAGDLNGDGYADVVIGSPGYDEYRGIVHVVFGNAGSLANVDLGTLPESQGFIIQGSGDINRTGYSVSSAGDVNGDGLDDLLVGAPVNDTGLHVGKAYLIFGTADGFGTAVAGQRIVDLSSLAPAEGFVIEGGLDATGFSVSSAGDFNGDGFADMIVGAIQYDGNGSNSGAAYLLFGKSGGFGTIDLQNLDPSDGFRIDGGSADSLAGYSVSAAGDFNGDGYDDVVVGALGAHNAYVLFGRADAPASIDLGDLSSLDGIVLQGGSWNAGISVAGGDINNDGFDDILIGAVPNAFVVFGRPSAAPIVGTPDDDMLDGTADDDIIRGLAGNDTIDGGPGADRLEGGFGDDTYFIDSAGDFVAEAPGGGNDTVITNVGYALAAGQEIELLRTYGSAYALGVDLTGNEFANMIVGDDGGNAIDGGGGADLMWGYAGNDSYYVDQSGDRIGGEAAGGGSDLVITNVSYTLAAGLEIELLRTYGSSIALGLNLTGNEFANTIVGDNGANVLDGKGGADLLWGYAGDDTYYVDNSADRIGGEGAGGGSDRVVTNASFALAAGQQVELMTTYGSATTAAINLTGNEFANTLVGNAAANVLDGKGGADAMWGYAGNDTYYVDSALDTVVEAVGGGLDLVVTNVSYTLAAGQEIETLRTSGSATTFAVNLTGNAFANTLVGNAAANVLDGKGSADAMWGYAGNDTYHVDSALDTIVEAVGGGSDLVVTNVSYALAAGQEVEQLATYGSATTATIDLAGNEFANTLVGNAAANVLNGKGGADAMWGHGGNDTYYVDQAGDSVIEAAGGGSDTVIANVSYTLAAGREIEQLTTYGSATTNAINLTGNEFANTIVGNAAANSIDGRGGIDSMWGYAGNDTYFVDNAADSVTEAAGGGSDWVITNVSYTLAAGQEIETLTTYGSAVALGVDLTGNAIANMIVGDDGDNSIDGKGGSDILYGYAGLDLFAFTTALGAGNVDTLGDFQGGLDKILLENAIFTGLAQGSLPASAFVTGPAAQDADDRIIYNSVTGALYFDADGNGGGAQVQFATLNPGLALTANDFVVI